MSVFRIVSTAEAVDAIDHFNGFHDGFIKRFEVTSRDRFVLVEPGDPAIGHECTGAFDVAIDIAHYNYPVGALQAHDRVVRCRFSDVQDLCLDLRGVGASDWPIKVVEIVPPADGDTRFTLVFMWSRLVDSEWSTRSAELFTFATAELEEVGV